MKFKILLQDVLPNSHTAKLDQEHPTIYVPIYKGMMLQDLKIALINELEVGDVTAHNHDHLLADGELIEEVQQAIRESINTLHVRDGGNDQDVFGTMPNLVNGDMSKLPLACFIFVEES